MVLSSGAIPVVLLEPVLTDLQQSAEFHEKDQTIYVLNLLRNIIPPSTTSPPPRITTYPTLLVVHALRSIYQPSHFLYPSVMHFLLQRPVLDDTDIPLLLSMLYSSNDDVEKERSWKLERSWIIRFIGDGMVSAQDWKILTRRHTWDLLASLFQASGTARATRHGILNVSCTLSCAMDIYFDSE